ncbi:PilZ domain-containing protein [Kaarinaea lacus]
MEHRCSVRLPIAMNVLLYHNNIPVVHCKTDDIGADGMFVKSGPLKYRTNTILKVEFRSGKGSESRSHMITAMVVHHAKNGLGLMFPGGSSEAMLAWRDMVRRTVLQNSIDQIDTMLKDSLEITFDNELDNIKDKDKALSIA